MTLVELLVVIAILGILAASIAVLGVNVLPKSKDVKARAEIANIELALDRYSMQFRKYPPDTGFGLDPDADPHPGTYDAGSLWRYLVQPVFDELTGTVHTPFLEWPKKRLRKYKYGCMLLDPWDTPYGYVGDPTRVIHNQGKVDIFSCGPDGKTACNNAIDDPGPDGKTDGIADIGNNRQDPQSRYEGDNRAYNTDPPEPLPDGKPYDDDENGVPNDSCEFGPEASLNGDVGDDINNWRQK